MKWRYAAVGDTPARRATARIETSSGWAVSAEEILGRLDQLLAQSVTLSTGVPMALGERAGCAGCRGRRRSDVGHVEAKSTGERLTFVSVRLLMNNCKRTPVK